MSYESWWNDLRLAARSLARMRGTSIAAVLTLAVGVTGTTTVFAVVYGVLLRPLPVPAEDRLIVSWKEFLAGSASHWPFSASDIDTIARESRLLDSVAGVSYYGAGSGVVFEKGAATYLASASVTGHFFDVVGVRPVEGRALRPDDDRPGAENVLVISHGLWQRRYGGSLDALGRSLMIGDQAFRIVGVMPPDFEYPRGAEAWMTLAADASKEKNAAFREGILRDVDLVARLRPEVGLAEARSELQGFVTAREAGSSADSPRGLRPVVRRYRDVVVGDMRRSILVLFAAVGLVLFIASANVANLLLMRSEVRRQELVVRAALGAGPLRLARQMLAESAVLAATAGLVGWLASRLLLRVVTALVPDGLPRLESVRLDPLVFAFALGVTAAAAAIAGMAPALSAARLDLTSQMRGGRQVRGGPAAWRGRRALLVVQVALALPVLAGTGLLTRSLLQLQNVEMGMAADRLVFADLGPSATKEPAPAAALPQFLDTVVAQLAATPGIDAATAVNTPPFAGTGGWDLPVFTAEGQGIDEVEKNPALNLESVRPEYFSTLQVPLARGRVFSADDRSDSVAVAIVSEDLAKRIWPTADPMGRRMKFGRPDSKDPWLIVVGIVKPTRYRELRTPRPTLYLPAAQFMMSAPMLVVRTTLPMGQVSEALRTQVRLADPTVDLMRVTTFAEQLARPLARPRFNALLISAFGVSALLLATIGVYAVAAAAVRQRYSEIGIRIALGATHADVYRLVIAEGLWLAMLGSAVGLVIAVLGAHSLGSLLFDVQPLDPLTLTAAAVLILGAAGTASWLPARRVARLDPAAAVRAE